jgi:hypothetical protein
MHQITNGRRFQTEVDHLDLTGGDKAYSIVPVTTNLLVYC